MIKVAIFEDNKERRESLQFLIQQNDTLHFVGAFENGKDAVKKIEHCQPDIVLMDIGMPSINGIEATQLIKEAFPEIIILIQTIHEDDENLFKSLQAGANGYILKRTSPEKIIEAIKDAIDGGAPITPAMAYKVLQFFQKKNLVASTSYGISDREKQILKHLVDGNSYKMIADKESISYHTVNSHVRNIYDKLHVHSAGEAITKALREDLIK